MRRAAALVAGTLLTLLLVPACSSSGGARPAYRLAALTRLLVSVHDVALPGYAATRPDGEQQPHTTTATVYFNRAGFTDSGLHSSDTTSQLLVTLIATRSASAARTVQSAAVSAATATLRDAPTSTPVALGAHGREVAGRAKGDGAAQRGVYFVEGDVAVSVILSSVDDQPVAVARNVARAQDAKLRAAA